MRIVQALLGIDDYLGHIYSRGEISATTNLIPNIVITCHANHSRPPLQTQESWVRTTILHIAEPTIRKQLWNYFLLLLLLNK